jgi:hypothetical protein
MSLDLNKWIEMHLNCAVNQLSRDSMLSLILNNTQFIEAKKIL